MKKVVRSHVKDFCLEHIFECGQAFRFEPQADGSYTGIAGGNIANLRFDADEPGGCEGTLTLSNVSEREYETFWKGYLDLERDYGARLLRFPRTGNAGRPGARGPRKLPPGIPRQISCGNGPQSRPRWEGASGMDG